MSSLPKQYEHQRSYPRQRKDSTWWRWGKVSIIFFLAIVLLISLFSSWILGKEEIFFLPFRLPFLSSSFSEKRNQRRTSGNSATHSFYPPMAGFTTRGSGSASPSSSSFLDIHDFRSLVHCIPIEGQENDPRYTVDDEGVEEEGNGKRPGTGEGSWTTTPRKSQPGHQQYTSASASAAVSPPPAPLSSPIFFLPSFLRSFGTSFLDEEFYNAPFTAYHVHQMQTKGRFSFTCYFPVEYSAGTHKMKDGRKRTASNLWKEKEKNEKQKGLASSSSSSSSSSSFATTSTVGRTSSSSSHLTLLIGPPTPSLQSPFRDSLQSYFQNFSYSHSLLHSCFSSSSMSRDTSSSLSSLSGAGAMVAQVKHLLRVVLFKRRLATPPPSRSRSTSRWHPREMEEEEEEEHWSPSSSSSSFLFDKVALMLLSGVPLDDEGGECAVAPPFHHRPLIVEEEEWWDGIPSEKEMRKNTQLVESREKNKKKKGGDGGLPSTTTWVYEPQPPQARFTSSSFSFFFFRWWRSLSHRYRLDIIWNNLWKRYPWFSSGSEYPSFKAMMWDKYLGNGELTMKKVVLSAGVWKRLFQERKIVVEFVIKEWELPSPPSLMKDKRRKMDVEEGEEDGGKKQRRKSKKGSPAASPLHRSSSSYSSFSHAQVAPPSLQDLLYEGQQKFLHIVSFPPVARKRLSSSPTMMEKKMERNGSKGGFISSLFFPVRFTWFLLRGKKANSDSSVFSSFYARDDNEVEEQQQEEHRPVGEERKKFQSSDEVHQRFLPIQNEEEEFVCDYNAIQGARHHYLYDPIVYVNPHSSPSTSMKYPPDHHENNNKHDEDDDDDDGEEDDEDEEEQNTRSNSQGWKRDWEGKNRDDEEDEDEDDFFYQLLGLEEEPPSSRRRSFTSPSSSFLKFSIPSLMASFLPLRPFASLFFPSSSSSFDSYPFTGEKESNSFSSSTSSLFSFSSPPLQFLQRLVFGSSQTEESSWGDGRRGSDGGGFSLSSSQRAAKRFSENTVGELGPTSPFASSSVSAPPSEEVPSFRRGSGSTPTTTRKLHRNIHHLKNRKKPSYPFSPKSLFTRTTHQVYAQSVVVLGGNSGVNPGGVGSGAPAPPSHVAATKERMEEMEEERKRKDKKKQNTIKSGGSAFSSAAAPGVASSSSTIRGGGRGGKTNSTTPTTRPATVFLTRYQYRWEAMLPASRSLCLSLAPTAHMKMEQVKRQREQQESFRSSSHFQLSESWSEPYEQEDDRDGGHDGKGEDEEADHFFSSSSSSHGPEMESTPLIAVDIHEEIYYKKTVFILLFLVWLLGCTHSIFLKRGAFLLELFAIGLCGGLFLAGTLLYYLGRKIPQLGFGKRTLFLLAVLGGVSAMLDLLIEMGEHFIWVLDTKMAFAHWRAYLFLTFTAAWILASFIFRVLLPPRLLTTISSHSIDGIRLILFIAAFFSHAEATFMTVVLYLIGRLILSIWLFLLWLRYDPLLSEEKERKRKAWRSELRQREKERNRRREHEEEMEDRELDWKRFHGYRTSSSSSASSAFPGSGRSSREWDEGGEEDGSGGEHVRPARASMLSYAKERGSRQIHRLRRSSCLSYLLNTSRLSGASSAASRSSTSSFASSSSSGGGRYCAVAAEPITTTFRRRLSYRSQTAKHYTITRLLLRWSRRVIRTLSAIVQHSLEDLDSEASGSDGEEEIKRKDEEEVAKKRSGEKEEKEKNKKGACDRKGKEYYDGGGYHPRHKGREDDPLDVGITHKKKKPQNNNNNNSNNNNDQESGNDNGKGGDGNTARGARGRRPRSSALQMACLHLLQSMAAQLERRKHPQRYRYLAWHSQYAAPGGSSSSPHQRTQHPLGKENKGDEDEEEHISLLSPSEAVQYKTKELLAWRKRVQQHQNEKRTSVDPENVDAAPPPSRSGYDLEGDRRARRKRASAAEGREGRRHRRRNSSSSLSSSSSVLSDGMSEHMSDPYENHGTANYPRHSDSSINTAGRRGMESTFSSTRSSGMKEEELDDDNESFLSSSSSSDSENDYNDNSGTSGAEREKEKYSHTTFPFFHRGMESSSSARQYRTPHGIYVAPTSSSFYRYGFRKKNKPSTETYFNNSINDPLDVFPSYVYKMAPGPEADHIRRNHRYPREVNAFHPPAAMWNAYPAVAPGVSHRGSPHACAYDSENYTKQSLEQLAKHIRSQNNLDPLISRLRRPKDVLHWAKRAAPSSSDDENEPHPP